MCRRRSSYPTIKGFTNGTNVYQVRFATRAKPKTICYVYWSLSKGINQGILNSAYILYKGIYINLTGAFLAHTSIILYQDQLFQGLRMVFESRRQFEVEDELEQGRQVLFETSAGLKLTLLGAKAKWPHESFCLVVPNLITIRFHAQIFSLGISIFMGFLHILW